MLRKVTKYELQASGRLLLPFFALALAVCGVLRLLLLLAPHIWAPAGTVLTTLAAALGPLLLVAVILLTFVALIVRFAQSMAGNEAYLSFTLPVKTGTHLTARLVVAIVYSLLSAVVALLCGWIFIPGFTAGVASSVGTTGVFQLPFGLWASLFGWILVISLAGLLSSFLQIYAGIAIGTQFSRHRIIGSVVGYFLLNTVEGFLSLFLLLPLAGIASGKEAAIMQYATQIELLSKTDPVAFLRQTMGLLWLLAGITLVVTVIFGAINYVLCRYFFSKKLNLE